jgi:hypothetical protein
MSKDPNPEQPGRVFDEHLHDRFKLSEPKLPPDERRRRVVQLCCSFMRNLAFHRAGVDEIEVKNNLLNPNHPQAAFWLEAHGNFFDICVLDWCKLFADRDRKDWGKHHWRRVVENPDRFEADLYPTLGVTADAFIALITNIKGYRDKFVAHLDEERAMLLPALDVAKGAIVFLHERLAQETPSYGDWQNLPTTAEQLDRIFTRAFEEAQSVYADALARLAAMER